LRIPRLVTKRNIRALALLAVAGLGLFWVLTLPHPLQASAIPAHQPDLANGERLYNAGGCHSCHLPGPQLASVDKAVPAGGAPLVTPIGTLYPPNLTPDPETGIGGWTDAQFVNAMMKGLSPTGEHLIPAFPYTSYTHMKIEDVLDIKAYLATFPAVKNVAPSHDVVVLPLIRRGLGLWKYVGFHETPFVADASKSDSWNRGAYLVIGPGHCNECHTPRTFYMASDDGQFLMGGPHPEGKGKVPSLRGLVERGKYKDADDLKSALQNGETFGYEHLSSGGMGAVQTNLSKLPDADVAAIAEYLVSLK
jgi:mono/diheme cytochrome c family protein